MILLTQFVGLPIIATIPKLPQQTGFQCFQLMVLCTFTFCFGVTCCVTQRYRRSAKPTAR